MHAVVALVALGQVEDEVSQEAPVVRKAGPLRERQDNFFVSPTCCI